MRIAQVSPLFESVPPKRYGGTERVVSYLTEELVHRGHEVTLFASGDSVTRAELVPACERALRLDPACLDPWPHHCVMIERLLRRADEFDLIHFHLHYVHFPALRRLRTPHVTTLHGRLDAPDLIPLYREFSEVPVVSISQKQREPLQHANWVATVYHGFPPSLYRLNERPGDYLAFLGRVSPEKGIAQAIEIARRAGREIRIAAKVSAEDQPYYEETIAPLLRLPHVTFLGEIEEPKKQGFLGDAAALLFPIDWDEPFGMVQVEAMACGTPVIAFRRGSVPEILDDGVTGFICDGLDAAVEAVRRLPQLRRRRCREVFEARFGVTRMADRYLAEAYERVMEAHRAAWP